ncbi:MAG TPA: trypsin-like peptidase domain-containing protein [Candidatus Limnocylindria bacterium]|nr:trypsin-like peptidase domain-containing protein [Candidatus Limnocylindria bacterium]
MTAGNRRAAVAALLVALATACIPSADPTSPPTPERASGSTPAVAASPATTAQVPSGAACVGGFECIPDVVREVEPSVVAILTDMGEGSGVVWHADGLVVTNEHVIRGVSEVVVGFADGQRVDGTVVAADPRSDLAVVEVARRELPAAEFADQLPVVGSLAIAIGNPLGFENTVTAGIVSGLHRDIPGSAQETPALVDLIQTDAAISPGNSGGALVDADAQVIGVNVAYIPPEARAVSIGFAIPAPTVVSVVEQLVETGRVRHAYLGVQLGPITPEIAQQLQLDDSTGALVLDVVPGAPADEAGLIPGDVIVALDGEAVETVEAFLAAMRRHSPGDTVALTVSRQGESIEVQAQLGELPG